MPRLRAGAIATLLVALVCFPQACTPRERGDAAERDALRVALPQEPMSLNPLLLEGPIAYAVSELLYSYLTNYDVEGNPVPELAVQVPTPKNGGISADGKRITFHLRHGVRWQDGALLTARDVVFTYHAIMSPANSLPERYGYDKIASIAAPDQYTVVITLRQPFAPIVALFFGGDSNYPVLPYHALHGYSSLNTIAFNQRPLGSGPYSLHTWLHGDRLELNANPHYFRGKPAIATLVLPFVHDPSTTVNQLLTGEVDAAFSLDASRIGLLRSIPRHRIVITPIPYFYALAFNMTDPLLRSNNVRRALALAVDRDTVVRKVSHGVYDPRTGLRGLFTWAFDPNADRVLYDSHAAADLLTREGWTVHPDGSRWKNGRRLQVQLAFPAGSDITAQLATAIAAAESALGVDVVLKRYSREVYMANDGPVMQGRFQMQLYDYHSNYDPDAAWLLACDQRSPGGFNVARYCNHSVDAALRKASQSYERSARRAQYAAIERRVVKDMPYFFLAQASEIDVIPANMAHYRRPLLSPFISAPDWVLERRRAGAGARVTRTPSPKKRRV
ncbi:MAG TPA: peptide ABC transporter substrate-binding protein [Candidatus Baltobacteraceae bacterium]|jgi:peptide/nickel transport system substrate-binding protein|nr:peptide ABC transporter substrate-binding protein [Candidatus Baltobacteraceae bacterium]